MLIPDGDQIALTKKAGDLNKLEKVERHELWLHCCEAIKVRKKDILLCKW